MSGGFALGSVANATDIGTTAASSVGTTVSNGSANTLGSFAQLIASTAADASGFWVMVGNSAVATQHAVDIAVGAAASEVVIASFLQFTLSIRQISSTFIPLQIPAGTRVSARTQSSSAADSCNVSMILVDAGFDGQGYQVCDSYGFNAGTSLGSQLDPGGSANTKGAYTQLTASSTQDYCGISWLLDYQNLTPLSSNLLMDIAVGAGGSEVVIVPNWEVKTSASSNTVSGGCPSPLAIQIPAGTRISARCQSTDNTAASRKIGITFYGFA